ncbi:PREDICTED: peroxidase 41-like [Ipomoea nil]|uniref:peroxidase 41-like n=1 Tax=Ipomoea nil TaxID=35883 RepID=UPI00090181D3|nr:PREDICTED: peroxidase 41-like [Ipomoea nil]
MALPMLLLLLASSFSFIPSSQSSALTFDYYAKTCPKFEQILTGIVREKQQEFPTTAAATLNLFYHDCAVGGCDASVLIKSTAFNKAEMESDDNRSLGGDGFDVIQRVKLALELECPDTVSCADILAVATRNLVTQVGGPHYNVLLGRKDGTQSKAASVAGHFPRANSTVDQIIKIFKSQGFTVPEMVVLTGGGHTIGFAHCKEFADRIFGPHPDPTMNPSLAGGLRTLCAAYKNNTAMAAFLDPITPTTFDNTYFKNLQNGLGILGSDQILTRDPRTKPFVEKYAKDAAVFAKDFSYAIEKLSVLQVKTGDEGEVRKRCDLPN